MEAILVELSLTDLLLNCTRVCHQWQDVMRGATAIQEAPLVRPRLVDGQSDGPGCAVINPSLSSISSSPSKCGADKSHASWRRMQLSYPACTNTTVRLHVPGSNAFRCDVTTTFYTERGLALGYVAKEAMEGQDNGKEGELEVLLIKRSGWAVATKDVEAQVMRAAAKG